MWDGESETERLRDWREEVAGEVRSLGQLYVWKEMRWRDDGVWMSPSPAITSRRNPHDSCSYASGMIG